MIVFGKYIFEVLYSYPRMHIPSFDNDQYRLLAHLGLLHDSRSISSHLHHVHETDTAFLSSLLVILNTVETSKWETLVLRDVHSVAYLNILRT